MPARQRNTVIEEVTALVRDRQQVPDTEPLALVTDWVQHLPDADLAQLDAGQLAGLVTAQLRLGEQRRANETLVQVQSPEAGAGPWQVLVVADDRPFTVDTIAIALTSSGWSIVELLHPQFQVRRDPSGGLRQVGTAPAGDQATAESWVGVLATPPLGSDPDQAREQLRERLRAGLADLAAAVADFEPMRQRMVAAATTLPAGSPGAQLLDWLVDDHFTYLAYREHRFTDQGCQPVPGTGLGTLRGDEEPSRFNAVPYDPVEPVVITKDVEHSRVHRGGLRDYVGVRILDDQGRAVGEHRFLGLLGHGAYTESIERIPVLRDKAERIVQGAGYPPGSHGALAIWSMLDTFPRDELFHASVEELEPVATAISQLKERRQVRLFVRPGQWGSRLTALVYFPRDRYNTSVRHQIEQELVAATGATSIDYQARVSESVLARLYFELEVPAGEPPQLDVAALQARLGQVVRGWADTFSDLAADVPPQLRGIDFPEGYTAVYTPQQAVADLMALNQVQGPQDMQLALYAPDDPADPADLRLKVMRVGAAMTLQDVMPHLTALGLRVLDERPWQLRLREQSATIYDFGLALPGGAAAWGADDRRRITEAFAASWLGHCDVDDLDMLVGEAGFGWREVVVLRALTRYLRQLGTPYSQAYLAQALRANPAAARLLVDLFAARFDPEREAQRDEQVQQVRDRLVAALDEVEVLDHDRILRQLLEVVQAVVRTNHYVLAADPSGSTAEALALKLLPRQISFAPQPRPEFELFVHSPRVEGVHLRFGLVARGGLRWSDRFEDFRTEVLGLVKAQMVKNTVIVPVGAKGGFVGRKLPNPAQDRAAWLEAGKRAYQEFVASLLSVTDDIVDHQVVAPAGVVRHDGDDPYLVVAADKGTATFSDLANAIAVQRGFWLGDAFASGGSVGYDHKAMGITAKGAWESVKQHFHELGVDCQSQDFTCVGIGDMSGDVFGNGMLLSRHTRLVAAFNHQHIFLDPTPDAASSYAERERLFQLPRSTWADYDTSLLSEGGGIHERAAKSVEVTPQVRQALGLADDVTRMAPNELVRAILAAPVDLLWNGGIGTYVKAASEGHGDVGDKANDAVRLDGGQVRARIAGEGGNLGWTQLGRIEYAANGGRINTDFIDNSAGVDTSDHEVNIKILLDAEVAAGRLSPDQRNALLPRMTDEVERLVLAHNVEQNLVLASARAQAVDMAGVHEDWMVQLEAAGYLDRALENMPSSAQMRQRQQEGRGLTSPELATLLAWSKIWLADELLASDLPDDPYLHERLLQYFPELLREQFATAMDEHRLHREIITTVAVNRFVGSQGMTAAHRLGAETGAVPAQVVRAQLAARSIFEVGRMEVNSRRAQLDATVQTRMRLLLRGVVEQGARWLLHRTPTGIDVSGTIERYQSGVRGLARQLPDLLGPTAREQYDAQVAEVRAGGVDEQLAAAAVGAQWAHLLLPCVAIAQEQGRDAAQVARVYFLLVERLGLDRLLERVEDLPRTDKWDTMARSAIRDDLLAAQSELVAQAVRRVPEGASDDAAASVDAWWQAAPGIDQRAAVLADLVAAEPDLARMSVGLRTVRSLVVAD